MKLIAFDFSERNMIKYFLFLLVILILSSCSYSLKRANQLYEEGFYREAAYYFRNDLKKNDFNKELLNQLAICELNTGKDSLIIALKNSGLLKKENQYLSFRIGNGVAEDECLPKYEISIITQDKKKDELLFYADNQKVYYYNFEKNLNYYYSANNDSTSIAIDTIQHNIRYFEHPSFLSFEPNDASVRLTTATRKGKGSNLFDIKLFLGKAEYLIETPHKFINDWYKEWKIYFPVIGGQGKDILVFSSRKTNTSFDLYISRQDIYGNWQIPEPLIITKRGDEIFPFIDINNYVYYSSNGFLEKNSGGCQGKFDIYFGELINNQLNNLTKHRVSTMGNDFKFFSKGDGTYSGYISTDYRSGTNQDIIHFSEVKDESATNHAIFFAMKDFASDTINKDLQEIPNAIKEVEKIDSILVTKYNFDSENTHIITNASKKDFFISLEKISSKLGVKDRLLLIISTHGTLIGEKGYLFPAGLDITKDTLSKSLISYDTILNKLSNCDPRHVLLIADACYSPVLKDARPKGNLDNSEFNVNQDGKPSRLIITTNEKNFTSKDSELLRLFTQYIITQNKVIGLSSRTIYSHLFKEMKETIPGWKRFPGHEGGDFIFYLKEK